MKQGREASGEAKRYEVEKTWKRNVPGEANPGLVGSRLPHAPKGKEPHESGRVLIGGPGGHAR